uniref:Uncharacterized protein n=1 Tax=Lepeophtheirus salmonis TaxID=72036 RepID=A0A0K2SXS2_LEPSM
MSELVIINSLEALLPLKKSRAFSRSLPQFVGALSLNSRSLPQFVGALSLKRVVIFSFKERINEGKRDYFPFTSNSKEFPLLNLKGVLLISKMTVLRNDFVGSKI